MAANNDCGRISMLEQNYVYTVPLLHCSRQFVFLTRYFLYFPSLAAFKDNTIVRKDGHKFALIGVGIGCICTNLTCLNTKIV
jgi:hypothetical protein